MRRSGTATQVADELSPVSQLRSNVSAACCEKTQLVSTRFAMQPFMFLAVMASPLVCDGSFKYKYVQMSVRGSCSTALQAMKPAAIHAQQ